MKGDRPIKIHNVAVIGAGPAGLVGAKELRASGMSVAVFEQRHSIGGTWNYSERQWDEHGIPSSGMYRSVTANASRPFLEFSDFPLPDSVPVYPRHPHIAAYLRNYAGTFGVSEQVRLGCKVLSIAPTASEGSRWIVRYKQGSEEMSETFDAVAIANGHHSSPRMPEGIPGFETFAGEILHSHRYKTPLKPVDMTGQRVLVVGIGNSGCDIATDLAPVAQRVIVSTRSGAWVFPRWIEGRPVDQVDFETRFMRMAVPKWLRHALEPLVMRWVRRRYFGIDAGVARWGLYPRFGPYEAHAAVNEQFFSCIANGSVALRGDVTEFDRTGARFADGYEEFDVVLFATGYSIDFPILSRELNPVDPATNHVELYQQIIAPRTPATLAFLGVVQPQTGFMPVIELQARWIAALWRGRIELPSEAAMRQAIAADRRQRESMYVSRPRHSIEVEWPDYSDVLARQLGVMPRYLTHPRVLLQLLFEPIHAAQYRLDGEGADPALAEETLLRLARNRRTECFNKP
jgi:cation diffusion facilitator CzcD-associated flavoprotein CzcO